MTIEKLKEKVTVKNLLRILGAIVPGAILELLRYITIYDNMVMYGEIEGGELRLLKLVHVIALLCFLCIVYRWKIPKLIRYASTAVAPAMAFVLLEYVTHWLANDMNVGAIVLNLVIYYLLGLGLLFLFRRTDAAVTVLTVLAICVGYISYYAIEFRGMPVLPWDIASTKTAMGVLNNYTITPAPRGMFVLAVAVLQITLSFKCNMRLQRIKWFVAVPAAICCGLLLIGSWYAVKSQKLIDGFGLSYNPAAVGSMYSQDGFAVAFILCSKYAEEPEGYSLATVGEIAQSYSSDSVGDSTERPNVIVIMNESWSDLSVLCDYETSETVSPFMDSLEENTIKGRAHVSVVGGNTPNSEFEFLTGLTMAFLPQGVIAYQQYINESIPTLVTQFNDLGYITYGAHAFWSPMWNRDTVYPKLGFQELYFKDKFPDDAETMRIWITDSAMYKEVEKIYESCQEPLFLFGVTMMNHGGYYGTYDNFDPYVYVEGLEDNSLTSTYMTLMRETDKAFQELVEYFQEADEKTVIVMFGDHQPSDLVSDPLMENAGVDYDENNLSQKVQRYITPYIIWANYDIDYDAPEDISLNYMAAMLMDICGLEKTGAQKYLLNLMEEYPIISSQDYVDSDGQLHAIGDYEQDETLMEYSILQYNTLLDKRNRLESFWSLAK